MCAGCDNDFALTKAENVQQPRNSAKKSWRSSKEKEERFPPPPRAALHYLILEQFERSKCFGSRKHSRENQSSLLRLFFSFLCRNKENNIFCNRKRVGARAPYFVYLSAVKGHFRMEIWRKCYLK